MIKNKTFFKWKTWELVFFVFGLFGLFIQSYAVWIFNTFDDKLFALQKNIASPQKKCKDENFSFSLPQNLY